MLNTNVFLVGIKQNNVISTNPFVVDAILPVMAKHVDIWTFRLSWWILRGFIFKDTINPLQLFVEKCQFFNQNYQWLNNIIYH